MKLSPLLLLSMLLAVSAITFANDSFSQDVPNADAGTEAPEPREQSVAELVAKGQMLFDDQRYEESIQTLSAVVARKDISSERRIAALKLLAFNHIVLGNLSQAKGVVWAVYGENEGFKLGKSESPRFRDFFKKHLKSWVAAGKPGKTDKARPSPVRIKHSPPAEARGGLPISLSGVVEDPDATVARLRVHYRHGSLGPFEVARVRFTMRKFTFDIPSQFVDEPTVEYYVQALDGSGLLVASKGDAEAPLRVRVLGPDDGGILTSPWLWVPVGIGVVAAVVIPIVVVVAGGSVDSTVTVNVFER